MQEPRSILKLDPIDLDTGYWTPIDSIAAATLPGFALAIWTWMRTLPPGSRFGRPMIDARFPDFSRRQVDRGIAALKAAGMLAQVRDNTIRGARYDWHIAGRAAAGTPTQPVDNCPATPVPSNQDRSPLPPAPQHTSAGQNSNHTPEAGLYKEDKKVLVLEDLPLTPSKIISRGRIILDHIADTAGGIWARLSPLDRAALAADTQQLLDSGWGEHALTHALTAKPKGIRNPGAVLRRRIRSDLAHRTPAVHPADIADARTAATADQAYAAQTEERANRAALLCLTPNAKYQTARAKLREARERARQIV